MSHSQPLSQPDMRILVTLLKAAGAMSSREIRAATGLNSNQFYTAMSKLRAQGKVLMQGKTVADCTYMLTPLLRAEAAAQNLLTSGVAGLLT